MSGERAIPAHWFTVARSLTDDELAEGIEWLETRPSSDEEAQARRLARLGVYREEAARRWADTPSG